MAKKPVYRVWSKDEILTTTEYYELAKETYDKIPPAKKLLDCKSLEKVEVLEDEIEDWRKRKSNG